MTKTLEDLPPIQRSAVFSSDGLYRYRLIRRWGSGRTVLFVCHNPSVAGKDIDDPTAVRMMRFAWFWGYDGVLVGNLGARVSTDPSDLVGIADPIGPENDTHLEDMSKSASLRIVAWGAGMLSEDVRARAVLALLSKHGDVHCLARTKEGFPRHPLARGKQRIPDETWPELYAQP